MSKIPQHEKIETHYLKLRADLDKEHYLESFETNSMELIEKLLSDIKKYRNICSALDEKNALLIKNEDYYKKVVDAYKTKNIELFKENQELHDEILDLKNTNNYLGRKLEIDRLQSDLKGYKFLLEKSKKDIKLLEKTLVASEKKYLDTIEKIYEMNVGKESILEFLTSKQSRIGTDKNLKGLNTKITVKNEIFDLIKRNEDIQAEVDKMDDKILDKIQPENTTKNKPLAEEKKDASPPKENLSPKEYNEIIKQKDERIKILEKLLNSKINTEQEMVIERLRHELKTQKEKDNMKLVKVLEENGKLSSFKEKVDKENYERMAKYNNLNYKKKNNSDNLSTFAKTGRTFDVLSLKTKSYKK